VVGVHMYGEAAADHISFGADLVQDKTSVWQLQRFVFPAVTYHELYHRAAVEATLRLRHAGATDLSAASAWSRVTKAVKHTASLQGVSEERVVSSAFKAFDKDNSGFVSGEELKEALRKFGIEIEDETCERMIADATRGQGDLIDYESFLKIFHVSEDRDSVPTEAR